MERQGPGFGSLPDEIMEEILSRFSVKALAKLTCVSKHWKSVISNPIFQSLRHNRNPPSLSMLSYNDHVLTTFNLAGEVTNQWDLPVEYITLLHPITGHYIEILPSQSDFNKLVCLTNMNRFYVCNPSTRRLIMLPQSNIRIKHQFISVRLGGFAYVPCRDEYVIVQLTSDISYHILTLSISNEDKLIYSTWKRVETNSYDRNVSHPWGIFVKGFFYWAKYNDNHLLSFDVEKETFTLLDLPLGIEEIDDGSVSVVELKGDLYMRFVRRKRLTTELWKLNNTDQTWTKHCSVYMDNQCYYSLVGPKPIYMNGDGEILFIMGEYLKYYNPRSETFRRIGKSDVRVKGDLVLHTVNMFLLGN